MITKAQGCLAFPLILPTCGEIALEILMLGAFARGSFVMTNRGRRSLTMLPAATSVPVCVNGGFFKLKNMGSVAASMVSRLLELSDAWNGPYEHTS